MANFKTENPLQIISVEASTDLTGQRFVKMTSGKAVVCGANGQAFGVLKDDVLEGQMGSVYTSGIVLVTVGSGGVTENTLITSDAAGKAIAIAALSATTPAGAVDVVSSGAQPVMTIAGGALPVKANGIALESVAENGQVLVKLI